MERNKNIYGKSSDKSENFTLKKLIIKNRYAKIYPKKDFLIVLNESEMIIGYKYIESVYVTVHNSVPLKYLYRLAQKRKVFLINENGYIVGEVKVGISNSV